jgi:hypothetical protein
VYHSVEVEFDASPGDSGAPYFFGNTAYGLHTDSTDDDYTVTKRAWYSPISQAQLAVDIELCTTATCS